jgi:ATP-dependent helicase/DNAse subunit B
MKMKAVDLAEMLRELIEAKINKCKREIKDSTITIEADRILAQIVAYKWVQARLQDLVTSNNNINSESERLGHAYRYRQIAR